MTQLIYSTELVSRLDIGPALEQRRSQIKQELRLTIKLTLQMASKLGTADCLKEIRHRLLALQNSCKTVGKTFIVVEERITCNQYELGGTKRDKATLFRGPSPDASVAICVTQKGSLLHRNGKDWQIYRNAGDVKPAVC